MPYAKAAALLLMTTISTSALANHRDEDAVIGGLIGAVAGAYVGQQYDHGDGSGSVTGALVGAAAGAALGAHAGHVSDRNDYNARYGYDNRAYGYGDGYYAPAPAYRPYRDDRAYGYAYGRESYRYDDARQWR